MAMGTRMRQRLRRNAIRLKRQEAHAHRWEPKPPLADGPAFRCRCGATTYSCHECGAPMNRREDLDEPFPPDLFGGEGVFEVDECKNGHRIVEPMD